MTKSQQCKCGNRKKHQSKQNDNIEFNTFRNYITFITLTNYYIVKDTFG